MIRIVENKDWVFFTLLFIGVLYLVVFRWLYRGVSVKEFLLQHYKDAQNLFLCWTFISIGLVSVLSVLFSQYIPVVPPFIAELEYQGFYLNKMGLMLVSLLLFYFAKALLTAVLYKSIGQLSKFMILGFIAQKFYFVQSLFLCVLCFVHYYYPIDKRQMLGYYIGMMSLLFIGKNLFYIFHKEEPLPREWYYKILYICTLQILPLLVVWKFLFI